MEKWRPSREDFPKCIPAPHSRLPPSLSQINLSLLLPSFCPSLSPSTLLSCSRSLARSLARVTPRRQLIDDERNLPRTGALLKTGQYVLSVGASRGGGGECGGERSTLKSLCDTSAVSPNPPPPHLHPHGLFPFNPNLLQLIFNLHFLRSPHLPPTTSPASLPGPV